MVNKITNSKPSVLWCYKKELGFSTHKKKRMKQVKKMQKSGQLDPNVDDPLGYYKDTEQVLGKTFGMRPQPLCILQDFEALTPNLLCRVVETALVSAHPASAGRIRAVDITGCQGSGWRYGPTLDPRPCFL
eukprot:Skav211245  [mRNA]  locus=scaffold5993:9974:11443:- [translate_table: standard]